MCRLTLSALSLAILAACQPATTELTEEQKAEIAAELDLLLPNFFDAWRDADFERGMGYWLDSPDVAYASQGNVTFGYSTMLTALRPAFEGIASQEFRISDQRTTVLAPDVVCVITQSIHTSTDTAGVTSPERQLITLANWVRHEGEWKVVSMHESSRPAPTPEAP